MLESGVPSRIGGRVGLHFENFGSNFGHTRRYLLSGSRLRGSNLLAQQFLIDQAIERGLALGGCERVGSPPILECLKVHFLFPIALQNHMAVYVGHHAVDDGAGWGPGGEGDH